MGLYNKRGITYTMKNNTKIFTIGSCFANEIRKYLRSDKRHVKDEVVKQVVNRFYSKKHL